MKAKRKRKKERKGKKWKQSKKDESSEPNLNKTRQQIESFDHK